MSGLTPLASTVGPGRAAIVFFLLTACSLFAGPADLLLEEQLNTLSNKDVKTTIIILKRLNKFFLLDHQETLAAPTPTEAQRQAGYVLFSRNYLDEVYYNSVPRPREIGIELRLFATPGEYEPVTFAVWPIEDLTAVDVTVSDLRGPEGALIKRDACEVRITRQIARGVKPFMYMVGPEALEPFAAVTIPAGRTTQFWLTFRVPADQPPGEYKGKVAFKPANRTASELSLTVVVLPFKLLDDPDMDFGWYYGSGKPETLRRELEDMRAHGCTTVTIPDPPIMKLKADGTPEIDFTEWEKYRALLAQVGMRGIRQTGIGAVTGFLVAQGTPELGAGFDKPFVAALREYKRWLDEHPDFRVVFAIYDEPRESMLNSWNRTYAQTMAYIKLCRQVPGLQITVNPMGDGGGDKDYTDFAEAVDILNTHAWDGSRKLIARARKAGRRLWVYNNGQSRLAWGFGVWKIGAKGEFEYVYPSWTGREDAYCPIPLAGYENEGASATGHTPVYPFRDRIVPTPRFEWCREGTDDYRYLYTLDQAMKRTQASDARAEAEDLLKEIARVIPEYPAVGLRTGAEAGASGDPAYLLAYFDHFRWRIALAILRCEDAIQMRQGSDPKSLYRQYSAFRFGELPAEPKPAADRIPGK